MNTTTKRWFIRAVRATVAGGIASLATAFALHQANADLRLSVQTFAVPFIIGAIMALDKYLRDTLPGEE